MAADDDECSPERRLRGSVNVRPSTVGGDGEKGRDSSSTDGHTGEPTGRGDTKEAVAHEGQLFLISSHAKRRILLTLPLIMNYCPLEKKKKKQRPITHKKSSRSCTTSTYFYSGKTNK